MTITLLRSERLDSVKDYLLVSLVEFYAQTARHGRLRHAEVARNLPKRYPCGLGLPSDKSVCNQNIPQGDIIYLARKSERDS